MLSKKSVKFCPVCSGPVTPEKKTPYSVCSCGLVFTVLPKPVQTVPVLGGHAHRQECGGKICHSSVAEAYARSLTLVDIPHRHRDKMKFYQCRWCSHYHIGHAGKHKKNATTSFTLEEARAAFLASPVDNQLLLKVEQDCL